MTPTVPHQALYRRWRAQTFSQIVGQEAVVETLRNAVRTERVVPRDPVRRARAAPARRRWPGSWPRPSTARTSRTATRATPARPASRSARARPSTSSRSTPRPTAASTRSATCATGSPTRPATCGARSTSSTRPTRSPRTPGTRSSSRSRSRPTSSIFMFASTEPSGFPPAILSRLQRFDVRRLTVPEIEGKLTRILEADGRADRARRPHPDRPPGRRRHARRRVDPRPAPLDVDATSSPRPPSATCSASPTPRPSTGSSRRC